MGVDKHVESRMHNKSMGIGANVGKKKDDGTKEKGQIQVEDLTKFGLIPEFLGRLPVIATLDELDEESLVSILTRPKNALVKQYQKLFELEGVKLEFDSEALNMIAQDAIKRKTGARGLRSIMENLLLDTMYDLPSLKGCKSCRVTANVLNKTEKPILEFEEDPDGKKEIA